MSIVTRSGLVKRFDGPTPFPICRIPMDPRQTADVASWQRQKARFLEVGKKEIGARRTNWDEEEDVRIDVS